MHTSTRALWQPQLHCTHDGKCGNINNTGVGGSNLVTYLNRDYKLAIWGINIFLLNSQIAIWRKLFLVQGMLKRKHTQKLVQTFPWNFTFKNRVKMNESLTIWMLISSGAAMESLWRAPSKSLATSAAIFFWCCVQNLDMQLPTNDLFHAHSCMQVRVKINCSKSDNVEKIF